MSIPTRHGMGAATAAVIGACAVNLALAQTPLSPAPCRVAGLEEQVQCATVEVPENRALAGGRTIALRVVILPSRAPASAPRQALFYLVGGPGLSATALVDLIAASHATTRSTHVVVLVDQRGTGGSNALGCGLYGTGDDVGAYLGDQFPADSVRSCAERLARRADLAHYTSGNAAEDLEAVRSRLGVERLDLDASAYGTRVALEYLRRHPDRVRSVVLQGVIPEGISLARTSARDAQRALDRVIADCLADPFCRTSFPGLRRELTALFARLDRGPLSVRVAHPRSKDSVTVTLTRGVVADRLRVMLHSAHLSRRIPMLVHRAHDGDWTPFVALAYELSRVIFDQLDAGAHLSAMCTDDLSAPADSGDTFLGDYRARMYRQACAVWPQSSGTRPARRSPTQAPALLVTGSLDPVTPPRFAEAVARDMPNAMVLIVPGMAHAGAGRCVEEIAAEFIRQGAIRGVDTSCVTEIKPPPFSTR